MFSCFLHVLFDCFWYRRQAGLVEDGGDSAAPANEEPVAAPAPAAAQTTSQSTNVRGINLEDSWTLQEHIDTSQGQAQTTNTTDTNVNAVDLTRPWSNGEWNEWARRDE